LVLDIGARVGNGIVITKSPVQVIYFGAITPESSKFTKDLVRQISKVPFRKYDFNPTVTIQGGTTGSVVDTQTDNASLSTSK